MSEAAKPKAVKPLPIPCICCPGFPAIDDMFNSKTCVSYQIAVDIGG